MNFIKKFISFIIMIVFFINLLALPLYMSVRNTVNYKNISNMIDEEDILNYKDEDGRTVKELVLNELKIDKELHKYFDIEDILKDYLKELVKNKLDGKDEVVRLDAEKVNDNLDEAVDQYLEDKDIEFAKDYINIDVSESDLEVIENEIDAKVDQALDREGVSSILKLLRNDDIIYMLTISLAVELILIGIVNLSISAIFKWMSAPTMVTGLIYILAYVVAGIFVFSGNIMSEFINKIIGSLRGDLKFFGTTFLIASIVMIVMIFVFEKLEQKVDKMRGVKTLDNFFDDYNSKEVVAELQKREEEEKKAKRKPRTKKKSTKKKAVKKEDK